MIGHRQCQEQFAQSRQPGHFTKQTRRSQPPAIVLHIIGSVASGRCNFAPSCGTCPCGKVAQHEYRCRRKSQFLCTPVHYNRYNPTLCPGVHAGKNRHYQPQRLLNYASYPSSVFNRVAFGVALFSKPLFSRENLGTFGGRRGQLSECSFFDRRNAADMPAQAKDMAPDFPRVAGIACLSGPRQRQEASARVSCASASWLSR
jgi:hypothetical protein